MVLWTQNTGEHTGRLVYTLNKYENWKDVYQHSLRRQNVANIVFFLFELK